MQEQKCRPILWPPGDTAPPCPSHPPLLRARDRVVFLAVETLHFIVLELLTPNNLDMNPYYYVLGHMQEKTCHTLARLDAMRRAR